VESQLLSPSVVAEFKRLRERFDALGDTTPPVGVCLVRTHNSFEDVLVHPSGLHCAPPPDPWLSLANDGSFESEIEELECGSCDPHITRTLIFNASKTERARLTVLGGHAGRLLSFVPRFVWPQVSTQWTAASRTENGWRWFATVFDLALGPPHPKLLSVDNPDRGGFFWWQDSQSRLIYVRDNSHVMGFIKRDGRYGAVISDMARQSALAISLILELCGAEPTPRSELATATDGGLPSRVARYTAEQKAWYWYQWICGQLKEDLDEESAFEYLKKLATNQEPHHQPPWSDSAEWPSTDISPQTFKKYLSRHRLKTELKPRSVDAGSVVQVSPQHNRGGDNTRALAPETPLARHPQAAALRAAESEQAARDAEAATYGFDIEPPIDSQGDPT
jgi:hypothetical protein